MLISGIQLFVEGNNLILDHFLIVTGYSIDKQNGDVVFSLMAISKRVEELGVAVPKAQPIHS